MIMTIFQLPAVTQTIQTELPKSVKSKTLLNEIDNLFFKAYKPENLSRGIAAMRHLPPLSGCMRA